ncbi:MAG: hypothetical protein O2909_03330 [Chloroflexi bacterium]|nr:hypothetical protein [Chloroflexota bacterium]MDA1218455.1 hypothetical protein [Chloroflexota bacterium]PKB56835.1 MAG: hypothetical protein BZY73_06215 [SAR202 cluster bacterium Casp-Chloro-G3]
MVKGVLIGLGIMVVSALIPLVHFVAVPASPFIAGYIGVGHAKESSDSYSVKGLKFGSLLGLSVLLISGIGAAVITVLVDPSQKITVIMWIGVAIFTLYTGSMATLGAMYSSIRADRTREEPTTFE